MTTAKRVAIIGAGISGLAHADVLTRCGFSVVLFERAARVGGVWACSYPDVRLQNTSWGYHLSSFRWPFEPDLHPTSAQIVGYLEALVAARRFDVRLRHEVVSARQAPLGGWDLRVRHGPEDGTSARELGEHVDDLVVSVGQYTEDKHRLALDGETEFAGEVVTERDLGDLSRFDGARVVVGFGKSALDMATFAAPRVAAVHHVFRTPIGPSGEHLTRLRLSLPNDRRGAGNARPEAATGASVVDAQLATSAAARAREHRQHPKQERTTA